MTSRKITALGRGIETLALVLGAGAVIWLVSVVLVQAAYRLRPVQPSEATIRLEQEAAQRPLFFENGFRYTGFLAPAGMDPLAFGRCMRPNLEERAQKVQAGHDVPRQEDAELQSLLNQCLQGQQLLASPAQPPEGWVSPSWTLADWLKLARTTPDPVLMERAAMVWRHGHLRLGTDFDRPESKRSPLFWLAQWRIASAVALWHSGHRDEALRSWTSSAEDALNTTGDDLIETMNATSTLTRLLLGLQTAVRSGESLDDVNASQANRVASLVEALPRAGHRSLISEWQAMAYSVRRTDDSVRTKWQSKREENPESREAFWYAMSFFGLIYDPVDTANVLADHFEPQRAAMLAAANGLQPDHVTPPKTCAWLDPLWHLCRPHERNPVGRWLARLPTDYVAYGTRISDLRNLAAATRLTIEVRRQGLSGEALARFITQAPEDMRDVFTRQPFAYDAQARELTIVLRKNSPILGDPGEYRLPL
jgi:hypothetical protein